MIMTKSIVVYDTLRRIKHDSIKDAWLSYRPEVTYDTFRTSLKKGKIPHLVVDNKFTCRGYDSVPLKRKKVVDVESGQGWLSITNCARDLGVNRQAVQLAIKRGRRCAGRMLSIVE